MLTSGWVRVYANTWKSDVCAQKRQLSYVAISVHSIAQSPPSITMTSQIRPPLPVPSPPKGYPSVASYISSSPDLAVFRKFSSLNARNLLNMQTELMILEAELKELDTNDNRNSDKHVRLRSWQSVLDGRAPEDEVRCKVASTMRNKLEEYSEWIWQLT